MITLALVASLALTINTTVFADNAAWLFHRLRRGQHRRLWLPPMYDGRHDIREAAR